MSLWDILFVDVRWIFDNLEQNYTDSQKLFNADNKKFSKVGYKIFKMPDGADGKLGELFTTRSY